MNRNLTNSNRVAILCLPCNSEVGRENPFRYGEKLPLFSVVFLCPSFRTTLVRVVSVMTGLLGQSSRLVAPYRGILTPFNSVAHTVRSIGFGYSSQDMEPPMAPEKAPIEQTQAI
jgi:hypothetical protein